jgi:Tfp pilus assembly protein PilF
LAATEFKAIVALDPGNADALGNLGVLLFFQGAYADAVPQFRAALKLQPTLWKIQALLGICREADRQHQHSSGRFGESLPKTIGREDSHRDWDGIDRDRFRSGRFGQGRNHRERSPQTRTYR